MNQPMHRSWIFCAGLALPWLATQPAAAQSFRETVNLVLLGSAKDRSGLVEIQDASDCVVKLSNPKTSNYAVLRFNNVDPRTVTIQGKPGAAYLSFSGPAVVLEVHSPGHGLTGASRNVQISARNPRRERRTFQRLYSRFCSGQQQHEGVAGS